MTLLLPFRRPLLGASWCRDALWRNAKATPSLDLDFATRKSLADGVTGRNLVTFTRASSGTYVGSDGLIKTATTNEARFDHNPTTGKSLGLLVEEQRTNLLLNSATLSTQSVTVTAAAHTLSFTGTGTITLSGTSTAGPLVGIGTGEANRVNLTFTPTAGTLTLTVSGTVSNAQLEMGAFCTSYIPTTSATVTRSADVASITGTNFSSWYRQDQMTLFASYALLETTGNAGNNRHVFQTDIGAASSRMFYLASYSGFAAGRARYFDESTTSMFPANTGTRFAVALATNNNAMSVDGDTPTVDLSGSPISGQTRAGIGQTATANGVQPLNGTIARLIYWPQRLPNAILQLITQ